MNQKIKSVIVLSPPATASSLISKALSHEMYMGDFHSNGHYEGIDFLNLNQSILSYARKIDKSPPLLGDMKCNESDPFLNPPSEEAILSSYDVFSKRIEDTINKMNRNALLKNPEPNNHRYAGNSAKFWGIKDGRIALTISIICKHLPNPHYIFLSRNLNNNIDGIYRKANEGEYKMTRGQCEILIKEYNRRIVNFLSSQDIGNE